MGNHQKLTGRNPKTSFIMQQSISDLSLFNTKQKTWILEGKKKRNSLLRETEAAAKRAVTIDPIRGLFKIDSFIAGSTGIGKSFQVEKAFQSVAKQYKESHGFDMSKRILIRGNTSIFQFGTRLMLEHYLFQRNKQEGQRLIVHLDDCDAFFSHKDSINILKNMTESEGNRKFQYNKMIPMHLLSPEMEVIIDQYRYDNGANGFEIDCSDISFIITTNFKLPTENQANLQIKKWGPTARATRLQDLAAIRRRFKAKDFILTKNENWGWIAYVCLYDGLLDNLNSFEDSYFRKWRLLDWMYNNWDDMTEHNLDTAKDMAFQMISNPDSYQDFWESDFIENSDD